MADTFEKWKDFLNPQIMRNRMLTASLFLVAHEMLINAVKVRLRDFYLTGFDESGYLYSPNYESKVLKLDPKGKRDPWRSSLVWLQNYDAINANDADNIRRCTDARNTFAHELGEIISGRKNPNFGELFPILVALVVKIDKWWIINTEIDFISEEIDGEIDFESVIPGSQLMLSIIQQSAIGDIAAAQALYEEFIGANEPKH